MDRSNFPPKVISTNPYLTLKELNIMNQTTISVRKLDKAQNFDQFRPKTETQTDNSNSNSNSNSSNNNNSVNEEKQSTANDNNNNSNSANNNDNVSSSNNANMNGRLIRQKIADDNSCLFNAIQLCVDKIDVSKIDKERTNELREMAASIILSDSDTYNAATLDNKSNEEYAQWIMNPMSWGGEIELSILSNILEIVIIAIDIETLKLFKYGIESGYEKTIFLCMLIR